MGKLDTRTMDKALQAAEDGNPKALYDLGLIYASGRGVPVDYVIAHMWFNLAAVKGDDRAREERAELAEMMSEDEVAEAQRQAREWVQIH